MNSLDKRIKAATNEHLRKIYNITEQAHIPKRRPPIKRHDCLLKTTQSEASVRSNSASRPSTRRNSHATPTELFSNKSNSMGPSKFGKIFKFRQRKRPSQSADLQLDLPHINSENNTPCNTMRSRLSEENESAALSPKSKSSFSRSSEEHEYLLFLLRITEDIIANDFYTNSDIKSIFKTHLESNKDRLNMKKMRLHIANLCTELNIDCKEYQMPELLSDEPDSPSKFQNSPSGHNYILNNAAFRSCQACSVIRTSSLYQMNSSESFAIQNILEGPLIENVGDSASISPSLLKLLEKLSLGRVTECTEPVGSISTMNSPRFNVPSKNESNETNNLEGEEQEPMDFDTFVKELNSKESIPSVPSEDHIVSTASESPPVVDQENPPETRNLLKRSASVLDLNVSLKKASNLAAKSALELTGNEFCSASEKFSSNSSALTSVCKAEDVAPTKLSISEDKVIRNSKIPILVKNSKVDLESEIDEIKSSGESHHQSHSLNKIEESSLLSPKPPEDHNTNLKLIIQGTVNDDDYVMIKGPVYVYKPLLDSEPKLIVFPDNDSVQKSRPNSSDSQHSHRTFTVDHSHVLDQAIQYEPTLHSVETSNSMDNILEMTKTVYSQLIDLKLLHSDYDLTPERDDSDNKYHYLMADATTSISGVNIKERLLLNDDYLVKNEAKAEMDSNIGGDMSGYVKYEPKMYENNYVIHRRLVSSSSMPTLNNRTPMSDRAYASRNVNLRNAKVAKKHSSDLVDAPSQDSSLRSEGETLQNLNCRKHGMAWNVYLNKQ